MTLQPLDSSEMRTLPKAEKDKAEELIKLWEPWLNHRYGFRLSEKISLLLTPKKQTA